MLEYQHTKLIKYIFSAPHHICDKKYKYFYNIVYQILTHM